MNNMNRFRVAVIALNIVAAVITVTAQVDVARRTTAVTYPLNEQVLVQFRGTTRFPRMKGEAKVRRNSRNGTEIELTVSKMPRPFELGAGYATYVLWAISPDGQADNLGEIKRRGFFEFDSKMSVTTPLQTFALIITAEPHFLVRRPSQAIMLENLNPTTLSGKVINTTSAIQYFGNSSDYFRDPRTPEIAEIDYSKTPSTILQAKQAVALARYAGAERDAPDEFKEAGDLLTNAEDSWRAGRKEEDVDITARRAISTAVKAESTAMVRAEARSKRNEKTRADSEMRAVEAKFDDAQTQIDELKAQLAAETRNRELAERDAQNFSSQLKDARQENGQLREELTRVKIENENTKTRLAALEADNQTIKQSADRDAKIAKLTSEQPALIANLKRFGTVIRNERGIVLTLPETLFTGIRLSDFAPTADTKLAGLADILVNNPDYNAVIESHTDNKGVAEELQTLTQLRAQAIAERITSLGVPSTRIHATGLGATAPIAPNTTNATRAKNRRVQIVLSPSL
jgi:outer membrane protein OmpA-like peptidoglycan-associated protein